MARDVIHPQIVAVVMTAVAAYAASTGISLAVTKIEGPEGQPLRPGPVPRPASLWGQSARLYGTLGSLQRR